MKILLVASNAKQLFCDTFCYPKIEKVLTKWGAIDKNHIFLVKQKSFSILGAPIIYLRRLYGLKSNYS